MQLKQRQVGSTLHADRWPPDLAEKKDTVAFASCNEKSSSLIVQGYNPSNVIAYDRNHAQASKRAIPLLDNGDHLNAAEFWRRYEAMPDGTKAELIEGIVYMPTPPCEAKSFRVCGFTPRAF